MTAFDGIRVLEIGGVETLYAGKLLADQGADVILVEPPEGHPSRRLPPYAGGTIDDVVSIPFAFLNGNKRSLVLPLHEASGRSVLRRAVERVDVVLAGGSPAAIRALGIDPSDDEEVLSSGLIITTVTPYGWTGPYADYAADDLTLQAMGGLMNMGGYHDARPLRPPANQSYIGASLFGAIGTAGALLARDETGAGQHVDVSIQESVVMALENSAQFYALEETVRTRHGGAQVQAARGVYACKDGYVYLMAGVRAEAKFWRALLEWFDDAQCPGREALEGDHWLQRDYVETSEAKQLFNGVFEVFCGTRTKTELYEQARKRGIPLAPVNDFAGVLENEQLLARGFLRHVSTQEWAHGPGVAPGAPYRMTRTPWASSYAPSTLGGDSLRVADELGLNLQGLSHSRERV